MTKVAVLLALAGTLGLLPGAWASDRSAIDASLPCNALCRQWMGTGVPDAPAAAAALDLHPSPPLVPPVSPLPPAMVSSVPPVSAPPREAKKAVPLPPLRPRFAADRRSDGARAAASRPASPSHPTLLVGGSPSSVAPHVRPVVAVLIPAPARDTPFLTGTDPLIPPVTLISPAPIVPPSPITASAAPVQAVAPVAPPIAFVLPRLDPAPSMTPVAAPVHLSDELPPFDVIAALLLDAHISR